MMDEAWLAKAESIFHATVDLPPGQRETNLAERCGTDVELRQFVERLIAHHESEMLLAPSPLRINADVDREEPHRIGTYEVMRKIGEGGMGDVYEARQENPRRIVALKVIRPEALGPEAIKRFRLEAQILGQLDHPGIARVHEAGEAATEWGPRPYFAMEFVRGRPLPDYVRERRLDAREKLELVAEVCDAVEYAHQKGVLHRDLKPANILVTESGSMDGRPKVLDFGVARAIHSDSQFTTMHTRAGQLVGTLAYMSPEQVTERTDSLDERSDVYQIGLILYEILTGRQPYDVEDLPIPEAARVIQREEPARLATADSSYRGDVDTIVAKALAKEKEHRYESAGALADDIRRHLADEPIVARPPSTLYRVRKFARRNRQGVLVATAAIVLLAVVLAVVATQNERLGQLTRMSDEPQLQTTRLTANPSERKVWSAAISPNGKRVAYLDNRGLHVLLIEEREDRLYPPPDGHWHEAIAGWYPGGARLLVGSVKGERRVFFAVSVLTGHCEVAFEGAERFLGNQRNVAALSPDGSRIAIVLQARKSELWIAETGEEDPVCLLKADPTVRFSSLAWSPGGNRISYLRWGRVPETTMSIETCDFQGEATVVLTDRRLRLTNMGSVLQTCWLPDGRIVYSRQMAPHDQSADLWAIQVDPRSGEPSGAPRRLGSWVGSTHYALSTSSEGERLATIRFDAQRDIYVMGLDPLGGLVDGPRRFTMNDRSDWGGIWSSDSERLFFSSDRYGDEDILAKSLETDAIKRIMAVPGHESTQCLTPDGSGLLIARWIPETTSGGQYALVEIPLAGGETRPLRYQPEPPWVCCATSPAELCALLEVQGGHAIFHAMNEDGTLGPELGRIDYEPSYSWNLSTDGSKIAFSEWSGRLRVLHVDTGKWTELPRQDTGLQDVAWSLGGDQLFVTRMYPYALQRIDLDGSIETLWEPGTWIANPRPSPDGRWIALDVMAFDQDVWMIEGI